MLGRAVLFTEEWHVVTTGLLSGRPGLREPRGRTLDGKFGAHRLFFLYLVKVRHWAAWVDVSSGRVPPLSVSTPVRRGRILPLSERISGVPELPKRSGSGSRAIVYLPIPELICSIYTLLPVPSDRCLTSEHTRGRATIHSTNNAWEAIDTEVQTSLSCLYIGSYAISAWLRALSSDCRYAHDNRVDQ